MASTIAWLDFSEDDQRRAREIVALFSQQESRDELGIGTVRDALSDALFPGISVIQTRARYFLFVPWLFREGERRGHVGRGLVGWVAGQERRLVEALRRGGEGGVGDGLIGRIAGPRIKILPSTIYWHGLQQFGICRRPGTISQVAEGAGRQPATAEEALTELVERAYGTWDPNLPAAPQGWFQLKDTSFALPAAEAEWLAERIVGAVPGTLLAWLITNQTRIGPLGTAPWEEPAVAQAPMALQRLVGHAERFSTVMHGAALLYNLLLAERCQQRNIQASDELIEDYSDQLSRWHRDLDWSAGGLLGSWDLEEFWRLVRSINPRISPLTRAFVDRWVELAHQGDVVKDPGARTLIAAREHQQKGGQARLSNDRLLGQWGGRSGTESLTFRWPQVSRILGDINQGRGGDAGP